MPFRSLFRLTPQNCKTDAASRVAKLALTVLAASSMLGLPGCQVPSAHSPSEQELIDMANPLPTEADLKERFRQVGSVVHEICHAPEFSSYFEKTPCLATLITEKHMQDKTRITAQQARAMRMALREFDELNRVTRRMMVESQLENYAQLARRADAIDVESHANQQNLLSGQITWGEYNRQRDRLAKLFLDAAKNL